MTLKEKEISERVNGKFKIIFSGNRLCILNRFTVKAAKKRAVEIADKEMARGVLIDITPCNEQGDNFIVEIIPNLRLAKGGIHG